jgi:hypothetical protein
MQELKPYPAPHPAPIINLSEPDSHAAVYDIIDGSLVVWHPFHAHPRP